MSDVAHPVPVQRTIPALLALVFLGPIACSRPQLEIGEPTSNVIYFTESELDTQLSGSELTHRLIVDALGAMVVQRAEDAASMISSPTIDAIVFGEKLPHISDLSTFRMAYRQGVVTAFINVAPDEVALFLADRCIAEDSFGREYANRGDAFFILVDRYVYGSTELEREKVMEAELRTCGEEPAAGIEGQVSSGSARRVGLLMTQEDLQAMQVDIMRYIAELQDLRYR